MEKESLVIQCHFTATYDKNPPSFLIKNNEEIVYNKTEVAESYTAKFTINTAEENNIFKIVRTNHDQVTNQMLKLQQMFVDEINVNRILTEGKYFPTYPEPWATEQIQNGIELPIFYRGSVDWGWNGEFHLEYTLPFYTWLLNNV